MLDSSVIQPSVDASVTGIVKKLQHFCDADDRAIIEFEGRCVLRFGSLEKALILFDTNGDQLVAEERFVCVADRWGLNGKRLWHIFDRDHAGRVTIDQIRSRCCATRGPISCDDLSKRVGLHMSARKNRSCDENLCGAHATKGGKGLVNRFVKWQGCHTEQRSTLDSFDIDALRKVHAIAKWAENDKYKGKEFDRTELLLRQGSTARRLETKQIAQKSLAASRRGVRPWSAGLAPRSRHAGTLNSQDKENSLIANISKDVNNSPLNHESSNAAQSYETLQKSVSVPNLADNSFLARSVVDSVTSALKQPRSPGSAQGPWYIVKASMSMDQDAKPQGSHMSYQSVVQSDSRDSDQKLVEELGSFMTQAALQMSRSAGQLRALRKSSGTLIEHAAVRRAGKTLRAR
jgi:hypothetical protein